MAEEMFELNNNKKVMGTRVKTEKKLGFDCFLAKDQTDGTYYCLYDETSGLELFWVSKDLESSILSTEKFLKRRGSIDEVLGLHNDSINKDKILPKFAKNMKTKYIFDRKNIKFDSIEYLKEFIEYTGFNKYFVNIINHKTIPAYAQNNTCYIYCSDLIVPKGFVHAETSVDIGEDDVPFTDVFDFLKPKVKGNVSKDTRFYTNYRGSEKTIAIYIHDTNVLLLSDISHSNEFGWCSSFIEKLKNEVLTMKYPGVDNKIEISIGSDPEFEIHINGINTCDQELQTGNRLRAKIGCDGSGKQMEIRPDPKNNPEEAVEEIKQILDKISYHNIRCDGEQEPLGGHLHFGISKNGMLGKLFPSEGMINALDNFIGNKVIKFSGSKRGGYGKIHDWREQPWGFEYRTPPAGIFFTKEMARIVYKIGWNIVRNLIENGIIETNLHLEEEDYMKIAGLTKEEYAYFDNFGEMYFKDKQNSIIENWTVKQKTPLKILFYDTWDEETKQLFIENLNNSVVTRPMTICLYGLNQERGEDALAGFSKENFSNSTAHPKDNHCKEGISFGLGKLYRNTVNKSSIKNLCNDIKRKIGLANDAVGDVTTDILFPEELLRWSKKPNGGY